MPPKSGKKEYKPGDNLSIRLHKDEDPLVLQFWNMQSNLADTVRYLVEQEIIRNGVRNLQLHIPSERPYIEEQRIVGGPTYEAGLTSNHIASLHTPAAPVIQATKEQNQEPVKDVSPQWGGAKTDSFKGW